MLPGRHCMACHKDGGQAGLRVWTAAGTVYGSPTAPCNTGGLPGIRIDIADALQNNLILITLYSNRTGNFFTAEARDFRHIIARVTDESTGRFKQMTNIAPTGDCGSCHFAGGAAGGPIFLN
jgi:mono/diheme cytochrome c family protein